MNLNNIMNKLWNSKPWVNISEYCNKKRHPYFYSYRKYRRGKNRCHDCGAKIGKIRCERRSSSKLLVDNIFAENTLYKLLRNRGQIKKERENHE